MCACMAPNNGNFSKRTENCDGATPATCGRCVCNIRTLHLQHSDAASATFGRCICNIAYFPSSGHIWLATNRKLQLQH